jgi:aspartate kinase
MSILVQKFGGTSVGDIARIRNVALKVKRARDAGHRVAVVVSAMSGTTDHLLNLARHFPSRGLEALAEYDAIVATGEQVSAGLLALALMEIGLPARSWAGWQMPLISDGAHGKARIREIGAEAMRAELAQGRVAVVTGFQGMEEAGRITTLGRGGSDTSAVALAAALQAERCDIYTDVDGIYTADPRIVAKARKLDKIAYEEILEMASQGAKVLQTRSVEMAMNHHVRVQVLSSFNDEPGTLLVDEEEIMEKKRVTGIACSRDDARITLSGVANVPGVSAAIFGPLAEAGINIDMIVQNVTEKGDRTDLTFTVPRGDLAQAVGTLESTRAHTRYQSLQSDPAVAKVSVIGVGMRSHAGIAQAMFQALADKNINILVISTSEIKVSVLIAEEYAELAMRALHTAYGLDREETR